MPLYRYPINLTADVKKVILQFFDVGSERTKKVLDRILAFEEKEVKIVLTKTFKEFQKRHKFFNEIVNQNFEKVKKYIPNGKRISGDRKKLIGLYFSKEYSIEASSLFNPSIVIHPNQNGLKAGETRFIISLRSTGEGHISSIEFRTGIIDKKFNIKLDKYSNYDSLPFVDEKSKFKKEELKSYTSYFKSNDKKFYKLLPSTFTKKEFIQIAEKHFANSTLSIDNSFLFDFVESNYTLKFPNSLEFNEQVIFPYSKSESVGMEDIRFVKFNDRSSKYYGTYTAYNGKTFRVQLIETGDFKKFHVRTLHGKAVQDKGMALFPRKINNKYWMISRQGGVNISVMNSENLYRWDELEVLKTPKYSWEVIQLGNCGSPIEIDEGWLLITHAVGAVRTYVISACLLDKNDPRKIIGCLREPLISPNKTEREGYVPNVVYSCGSILLNGELIIPFAKSDSATSFARISLSELLKKMK
jgi:predicted GH43/DUF377 family glycosyl hydrolase